MGGPAPRPAPRPAPAPAPVVDPQIAIDAKATEDRLNKASNRKAGRSSLITNSGGAAGDEADPTKKKTLGA